MWGDYKENDDAENKHAAPLGGVTVSLHLSLPSKEESSFAGIVVHSNQQHDGFSRELQADGERCRVAVSHSRRNQHEAIATTAEDPIVLVSCSARSVRGIRVGSVNAICQPIVEVQLRRELKVPLSHRRGANLEMDMHCPARIPARVHSDEPNLAARVGDSDSRVRISGRWY